MTCGTHLLGFLSPPTVAAPFRGLPPAALLTLPPPCCSNTAGPKALWKGLTPRLARTPPGQAIVWAVSDQITGYFEKKRRAQANL